MSTTTQDDNSKGKLVALMTQIEMRNTKEHLIMVVLITVLAAITKNGVTAFTIPSASSPVSSVPVGKAVEI
eukprot:2519300-Ditylum_brightwellii.AAC.1